MTQGPLAGVRILEFAGIGPGPFAGMLLSDMGADVLRIDRPGPGRDDRIHVARRGRRSAVFDLKSSAAIDACLKLMEGADAVFEGFRPGVMERLGLGPEAALARNPRLVYGRMTGWGQSGPLSQAAGHDINYIAISGALHAIGLSDKPVPPLNVVGDLGGGALYLVVGMLAALLHARRTGEGQVVDAAVSDGAASLMTSIYGFKAAGMWTDEREANLLDGGTPFYGVYRCRDDRWIALGSLEPKFFGAALEKLGVTDFTPAHQWDRASWPLLREKFAAVFLTRTQAEWMAALEGSDACAYGVLGLADAPHHPHNVARQNFVSVDGVVQPAPTPRFSKTPGKIQQIDPAIGAQDIGSATGWGLTHGEIAALETCGALQASTGDIAITGAPA